ncbi:MAG TPA: hypothetical protein VGH87_21675, partial [Polyangiaceae bacterium]
MKRALFVLLGLCACNGAADDGTPLPMSQVFAGFDAYDSIAVQGGVVSVEIPGSGVVACPVAGCNAPTVVASSISFVSGALGSPLAYAAQVASDDGVTGELHVVDGAGDRAVATGLVYPSWVATSGARMFVAEDSFSYDDTPAKIDCVGCAGDGQVTPWISGLGGGTYGLFADASNVYVLADDATLTSVQLLACSTSHPCFSEPRLVLADLDPTITAQQIASDGASIYVARAAKSDVVRVDASATVTPILEATDATAIAWDDATHALWFGTVAGEV